MRVSVLLLLLITLAGLVAGCANSSPISPLPTPTPGVVRGPSNFSTATTVLGPTPSPAVTATKANDLAELVLRWDVGVLIADIDDVSELAIRLRGRPGIVDAYGDEIQITITYDPKLIPPERVQRILLDLGYPTKKP